MKVTDFYKLQRAIQDRFVGSVMSGFPPAPLLARKQATPAKFLWLALSVVCFITLIIVARLGYGALDSGLSLHSWRALPIYVGLVYGVGFGLVQAWSRIVRERALPYSAGVYLFPANLIDARSDQFRIYDTKDVSAVDLTGSTVKVAFRGATFLFTVSNPAAAPEIVKEVQTARDRAMHAVASEDQGELVAVDPLHNPRFSSPVGPRDPYTIKLPPWGKLGFAVAAVIAVSVGPAIWALRNNGSDKTMYARATQANDTTSYRAYLERGQKFKDEVGGTLLPRAELRDAEKVGTVEALLDYKTSHPNSQIASEVALSIRSAMLGELEKAKAVGTLAALEEFAKKYPEHGVEPELREAKHAVYARELASYKARAATKEKTAGPFVERLFAWAEKNGPRVEVRFRRRKSDSLGRADQYVGKTPSFMGEISYPSRYFDEKHAVKREQLLGKMLTTKLDSGFSPELLDVQAGAAVPADQDTLPDVTVPTLFVTHGAEWSGHSYISQRPRGSYVGITFPFEVSFVIPGDKAPFKMKLDVFKQAALDQLKDDEMLPSGVAEEKVYDFMAEAAFTSFGKKILGAFFKEPEKDKPQP